MPDGTVYMQMDQYAERLVDPPQRPRGQEHPLLPNERKWIGTLCGQLNWMATQCRADLAFGVSRIQQLAGVADPAALVELKLLVDRARTPVTVKFEKLGCEVKDMVVVCAHQMLLSPECRGEDPKEVLQLGLPILTFCQGLHRSMWCITTLDCSKGWSGQVWLRKSVKQLTRLKKATSSEPSWPR